ncbi:MAG TPA: hypothetical protein VGJ18_06855 [Gemmatimonadaceae bacterium]
MPHFRRIDMLLRQIVTRFVARRSLLRTGESIVCAALIAIASCERQKSVPPIDSAVPLRPAAVGSASPQTATTWDARLGPVLLVSGAAPNLATVVVGDSSRNGADTITEREALAIRSTPAMLVGRGDSVQIGILQEVHGSKRDEESECTGWPTWSISAARSGAALQPWSVGFVGATVQPIRMDSIESMSRVDSSRLAAEVTRIASTLPTASGDRFVGLPFTVTSLWRFHAGPGAEGVVTNLVRHVNQEARPSEERTLIIAERDSSRREERFNLAYYDRSQGAEETVESRDVLALARPSPDAQPMLVIGRDFGDGMGYALIQRDPSARWREKWHSARGHCK